MLQLNFLVLETFYLRNLLRTIVSQCLIFSSQLVILFPKLFDGPVFLSVLVERDEQTLIVVVVIAATETFIVVYTLRFAAIGEFV